MDLANCTLMDLVLNESFQKWVLEPKNNEVHELWEKWLKKYPDQVNVVMEARMLVDTIKTATSRNLACDEREVWARISASIQNDERGPHVKKVQEVQNTD